MENIHDYLINFTHKEDYNTLAKFIDFEPDKLKKTEIQYYQKEYFHIPKYINEYWTAKQRQANSIHEVSYRACFKPQLPRFFIELLTKEGDIVFDPFSGRGTTAIESALLNRNFIANDINPLSIILAKPRIKPPTMDDITKRVYSLDFSTELTSDIDLSMFYHNDTLQEILCLKRYFLETENDYIDDWIRMLATNRLTGHSEGFFSVFTLPPNQSVSPESQTRINEKRQQTPKYRNVKEIIINKSKNLLKDINKSQRQQLYKISEKSHFLQLDARKLDQIKNSTIDLTVTSPPFLNIVQYAQDNWLRCWFNGIDHKEIEKNIVSVKTTEEWSDFIRAVFSELYRITKPNGHIAFEVGEVGNGKINLEEFVVDIGLKTGLECVGILVNTQVFTKTSNIWGINNNSKGTNSNRIVLFKK